MKINLLKILFLLLVGFISFSCENFLSPDETNRYTRDRVISDHDFAKGIMINGYLGISGYSNIDVATDDAVTNDPNSEYLLMATGGWSAMNAGPTEQINVWSDSYSAIFNLNLFLSVIDEVQWSLDETRIEIYKERYYGEARALRGFHYLRLLTRYGGVASDGSLLGVPIVDELITFTDNWQIPRASFQQTVEFIMADFNAAFENLPYEFVTRGGDDLYTLMWNDINGPVNNLNRINGKIVKGLKARTALLAASPAYNNGQYNEIWAREAAKLASELIKEKGGLDNFPQDGIFWDQDTDIDNPEIFWRNDWVVNRTLEENNFPPSLYGRGGINPTQNLVDAFPMIDGYPIGSNEGTISYDPQKPFENRDKRLTQSILVNGATLRNQVINTAEDSGTNDGLNKMANSTRTGYYLLKLLRPDVNLAPNQQTNARHFFSHIRWTELYLIYAETVNETNGPDLDPEALGMTPRTIIQAIRKRAGITQPDGYLASVTSKEDMRDLIRNERRLEFCFEGHRFWDIRRWNLPLNETAKGMRIAANTYTPMDVEVRAYQPYMRYCPIPYLETQKYSGLLQNQGW